MNTPENNKLTMYRGVDGVMIKYDPIVKASQVLSRAAAELHQSIGDS